MTNFDKITASMETMGAFLKTIQTPEGPWDKAFQESCCAVCHLEDCDVCGCPHQDERNNPMWWLGLEVGK